MPLNVDSLNAGTISQNGEPVKPYKVYTATLQLNNNDPIIVNILENTIGDIQWNHSSPGVYIGYLLDGFTVGKTVCFVNNNGGYNSPILSFGNIGIFDPNNVMLISLNSFDGSSFTYFNGFLGIEIRVYN